MRDLECLTCRLACSNEAHIATVNAREMDVDELSACLKSLVNMSFIDGYDFEMLCDC